MPRMGNIGSRTLGSRIEAVILLLYPVRTVKKLSLETESRGPNCPL
jgi:hypothetical protein